MFNRKTTNIDPNPNEVIQRLLNALADQEPGSEEFDSILDQITKLHALKPEKSVRKPVSYDTILLVVSNLLGIGMVINHERLNVITTKALGFVKKV